MKVKKGKTFAGAFTGEAGIQVSAEGKFTHKGKQASGTLTIAGGGEQCHTGSSLGDPISWTVSRGGGG